MDICIQGDSELKMIKKKVQTVRPIMQRQNYQFLVGKTDIRYKHKDCQLGFNAAF